jgi:hypothetical protein
MGMRFGHIPIVRVLASVITYSFQPLAPAVNNLQSLSITYTCSQQLGRGVLDLVSERGVALRYRETRVLVHNSVCNCEKPFAALVLVEHAAGTENEPRVRQTLAPPIFMRLPSNPAGEMQMACGLQLIARLFPLFGSSAIRDLWIGLRMHEAGQPDWP